VKKARVKGRWLRQIVQEESPSLIAKGGRRPSLAQEAAFTAWALKLKKRADAQSDIKQIVAKLKPALRRYLTREGFKPGCSGDTELRRGTGKAMLFLRDAFDVDPIAYAAWLALGRIEEIESALTAGDTVRACGASFQFGRLMQESDAHFAVEHTGGKNRTGKRSQLFEYTKAVWREGMSAHQLLSSLVRDSAQWDSQKETIRWRNGKGKWQTTKESTFIHSLLPGWKKLFREQVKND